MNKHPKIKVCGVKDITEVQLLNKYPIGYMGFIFAKSKRQLTIEKAVALRGHINSSIKVVGVFLNNDYELIKKAIAECALDVVQLHGDEDDAFVQKIKKLGVKVWKSIGIKDSETEIHLDDYPSVDGILFDTYHKGKSGGTGKAFNWDKVKRVDLSCTMILAGGLTPENAIEAFETVGPDVLDFNSGLEVDLMKNEDKVNRLFQRLTRI